MKLTVRVTPRAGRDASDGWMLDADGRPLLKLKVRAAPADGEANAAVVALLARLLNRPKSAVAITAGHGSRIKQIELEDVSAEDVARTFGPPPEPGLSR